jgi:hypothetical protein
VFFQHGVLDTSLGWVANGVQGSQAFAAWDAGHDVWLGNARSNPPRMHEDPGLPSGRYWHYSLNQLGMQDVAAQVCQGGGRGGGMLFLCGAGYGWITIILRRYFLWCLCAVLVSVSWRHPPPTPPTLPIRWSTSTPSSAASCALAADMRTGLAAWTVAARRLEHRGGAAAQAVTRGCLSRSSCLEACKLRFSPCMPVPAQAAPHVQRLGGGSQPSSLP